METPKPKPDSRPPRSTATEVGLLGSMVVGAAFIGLGSYTLLASELPRLFTFVLLVIGVLALLLAQLARAGRRAPWAYLVAMWGVVAFCGFFTAPEVLDLQHVKQVTVELELKHGANAASKLVDRDNLAIRGINFGLCVLFAAPFIGLCATLFSGRRDYEQPTA